MDICTRRLEDDNDTPEEDKRAQRVMVVRVAGDDKTGRPVWLEQWDNISTLAGQTAVPRRKR